MYLPELKQVIDFIYHIFRNEALRAEIHEHDTIINFTKYNGSCVTVLATANLDTGEVWIRVDAIQKKDLPDVKQAISEGRFSNLEIDDE